MQLDQARIAIHERSWSDNLDLALHVITRHAAPLALWALAGVLPLALVNDALVSATVDDFQEGAFASGAYWLVLLVMIEAPLATAFVTVFLGRALFTDSPRAAEVARDTSASLPQVLLLGVLPRIALIPLLVTWMLPFGIWPYLNEVILLERNPLQGRPGQLSTLRRSRLLHAGGSGEFMLQGVLAMCIAGLLIFAIYFTEEFLIQNLFGLESDMAVQWIELQIALWLVVVYFTVVRFLNYLGQRIRHEGWEVELFLRAEREHLTRQMT
jgi:hypothetical protein